MSTRKLRLTAMLLLALGISYAGAFTCDVSVGSADAATSFTFGSGTEKVEPFPPFSGQFGVKDFCLKNQRVGASGEMLRLGTDVSKEGNTWLIDCGNSDGTLYFKGEELPTLYFAYTNPADGEGKTGTVAEGKLSVKGCTTVKISTSELTADDAPELDGSTIAAEATVTEDGKDITVYQTEEQKIELDAESGNVTFYINAGGADVNVNLNGKIYDKGGNEVTDDFKYANFTGYICHITGSFTFKSYSNGELVLEISNETRGADFDYYVEATKSSLPNLVTTVEDQSLRAVIPAGGTLDFDGNGVVNYNDALFFYNYVGLGGADLAEEIAPYADGTLTSDVMADAENALEYFKGMSDNLEAFSLVEADEIEEISDLSDSATFFYNYMGLGGADLPEEITPYTTRKDNSEQDLKDAQEAMDKISEMMQ